MLNTEALAVSHSPVPLALPRLTVAMWGEVRVSFGVFLCAALPPSCPNRPRTSGHQGWGGGVPWRVPIPVPISLSLGSVTLLRTTSAQSGTKAGFSFDKRVRCLKEKPFP